MTPAQRYFGRMVSLVTALITLSIAALAYNLAFDVDSTLVFLLVSAPNLYLYVLNLVKHLRIERDCRLMGEYMRRNQQWRQWPYA